MSKVVESCAPPTDMARGGRRQREERGQREWEEVWVRRLWEKHGREVYAQGRL